jgi:hypothetical protein
MRNCSSDHKGIPIQTGIRSPPPPACRQKGEARGELIPRESSPGRCPGSGKRSGEERDLKSLLKVCMACLACLCIIGVPAAAQGEVTVDPAAVTATLSPGETQNVQVSLMLPGSVPKGDVVFAFDTTGSMAQVLKAMQTQGIEVMSQIRTAIPDTRFGVASFMDYPKLYDNYYGYPCPSRLVEGRCMYGLPDSADYAYFKDLDLNADINAVSAAIGDIPEGDGGDGPQDYTRVIYESQFFSWNEGAKKILVIFGDAAPHAAPNGTSLLKTWETGYVFTHTDDGAPYGGDPGRDEEPYTSDDLDYELVIRDAADRHITIVGVYCPEDGMLDEERSDRENNFRYMADVTGGAFVLGSSGRDASEVADQIVSIIEGISTEHVKEISVRTEEEEYTIWVSSPDVSTDVPWPSTEVFNVAITPPAGTPDGDYSFHLAVVGDGVILGPVPVTIHVSGGQVLDPAKVRIDIKPGSCPNSFNVKEKGVLPVAILGSKDLKASEIDPKSIVLTREGGTDGVKPIRTSLADVASASLKTCSCGYKSGRPDRKQDLNLKFDSQELVKKLGIKDGEGCIRVTITGNLKSTDPKVPGQVITGSDSLRVLRTGHGPCGEGDSKDDKGSCDKGGSCNGKGGSSDKGGSCDGKGISSDKGGSCDGGGSFAGEESRDEGNPWDDDGPSSDDGRGNGRNSRN